MSTNPQPAALFVHGSAARSWAQVASYLLGDAHDRSKVQVFVNSQFLPLVLGADDTASR